MTEPLDEPLGVVAGDELADDPARLGETLEAMEIEALLFQRPHEALDDAVALRLAHVRRRDRHPQPLHLVDPGIGDVLRAPVAPDPETPRDVLRETSEDVTDTLAQRLERRPAITDLRGVPADQLVDAMIDRAEEPAPAVRLGVAPRRVGAPHLVRPRGGDRAGMRGITIRRAQTPGREQLVRPHQPQDALAPDGESMVGEPRADLAVTLAVERRGREDGADRLDHRGVVHPGRRPALRRNYGHRQGRRHREVYRRARHSERGTDHRQRIPPAGTGTHRAFHRRSLFHSSVSPLFSMSQHGPLAHPRSMKISYHPAVAVRPASKHLGTGESAMSLTWELSVPRIVAFEHAEQNRP